MDLGDFGLTKHRNQAELKKASFYNLIFIICNIIVCLIDYADN